ncbi:MAG: ATP-binding protein [Ferrovum sp.]|jgi:DNA replication protein DnaC|nr:ATP-binding protein [Ferrovum sp.]
METAHNLILVGGTGTVKSHLATAISVAEIHHSERVNFFNAVDLANQLEREKNQGMDDEAKCKVFRHRDK